MINFTKIARERGAKKVELLLERHPVVASNQPTSYKISKIVAYRTDLPHNRFSYNWNKATMGVRYKADGDFIYTKRGRFLVLNEKEL